VTLAGHVKLASLFFFSLGEKTTTSAINLNMSVCHCHNKIRYVTPAEQDLGEDNSLMTHGDELYRSTRQVRPHGVQVKLETGNWKLAIGRPIILNSNRGEESA